MVPLSFEKFQGEQNLLNEVEEVDNGTEMISGDLELIDQKEQELIFEKNQLEEQLE